ncbi:hypothetical protein B484DRAFT_400347 [Ochromonadaceae sp. CCMP2298]|nr:hypothetical protein B484DRAFT_400347 [Ochromonadaceae sp. CCMP2298]
MGTGHNSARLLIRYRRFIGVPDLNPLHAEHLTDELMAAFLHWYCRDFGLSTLPSNTRPRIKSIIGALQKMPRCLDMPTIYDLGYHYPLFVSAVQVVRMLNPNPW